MYSHRLHLVPDPILFYFLIPSSYEVTEWPLPHVPPTLRFPEAGPSTKDFNITSATFLTAVDKSLTGNKGGMLIATHSLEGCRPLGWGATAVWGVYTQTGKQGTREVGTP